MSTVHGVIVSRRSKAIFVDVIRGHFATGHSHVNYFIDLNQAKDRLKMAREIATELSGRYTAIDIDTILCMDGTKMIGTFIADALTQPGMILNSGKDMGVIRPEQNTRGHLIFRDSNLNMVRGKNVLMIVSSISTGITVHRAMECLHYYGGHPAGVCALFSILPEIEGHTINTIFTNADIPDYRSYQVESCSLCAGKHKLDGVVNAFGYSHL
ncbi:MAG: orotate phosphoribosyltransferase [Oscillospiraceae bacterium]|nr:orotate phosphoribosyltransferase [Oscillospiraceae bacterium]